MRRNPLRGNGLRNFGAIGTQFATNRDGGRRTGGTVPYHPNPICERLTMANNPSIPPELKPQYDAMVADMNAGELDPLEFANKWAEMKSKHALALAEERIRKEREEREALEALMASGPSVYVSQKSPTSAGGWVVMKGGKLPMRSHSCSPDQFLALAVNHGNVFGIGVAMLLHHVNGKLAVRDPDRKKRNGDSYDTFLLGDVLAPKPKQFVLKLLAAAKVLNIPVPEGFRSAGVLADGSDDPDIHRLGVDHID